MPAEARSVAQVEVHVVAFLRTQFRLAGFQVFVAEKFVGGGQAVGFLVGEFGLQHFQDEPRAGRAVAERTGATAERGIIADAVVALRHGAFVVLGVVFPEHCGVPTFGRHEAVGEPRHVLACPFGDAEVREPRAAACVGAGGAPEGAQHVVERERVRRAEAVVCRERAVPVGVLRLVVLVGLFAGASGVFPVA